MRSVMAVAGNSAPTPRSGFRGEQTGRAARVIRWLLPARTKRRSRDGRGQGCRVQWGGAEQALAAVSIEVKPAPRRRERLGVLDVQPTNHRQDDRAQTLLR